MVLNAWRWQASSLLRRGAVRFLADFENVRPQQVFVVVGLDLLRDALTECSPQGFFAARVQHLLLDR